MGFFSLFATCAICGEEVGLNRYLIGKTTSGKDIWKCPSCTKKGGAIYVDYVTEKATLLTNEETEVRAKCNVCGHVYCYDITDVERNKKNARMAMLHSAGGLASAAGGAGLSAIGQNAMAKGHLNAIVDYSKCPLCHSSDVTTMSKADYELSLALKQAQEQSEKQSAQAQSKPNVAEELRSYKALLDEGVITKEEFEAKKKQLLGL